MFSCRLATAAFLISAALGAQASSPIAEVICQPTAALHDRLERQFLAVRSATGLRGPDELMEVWTTSRGDWTLVMTYANGTSCIVAMGEAWAPEPEKPA